FFSFLFVLQAPCAFMRGPGILFGLARRLAGALEFTAPLQRGLPGLLGFTCLVGLAFFLGQPGFLGLPGNGFFQTLDQIAQALVVALQALGLVALFVQRTADAFQHFFALGFLLFERFFLPGGIFFKLHQL